jgi:hypothetical protein
MRLFQALELFKAALRNFEIASTSKSRWKRAAKS